MLRSCAVFKEPLRDALHHLKYKRDLGIGESMAWIAARYLEQVNWKMDIIVPIPLSPQRMAERGYNQVGLIALPLALITGFAYAPRALARTRHTKSQVGLNAAERQQNVIGAFAARDNIVRGKKVLLVDDTATTGATLNSAAQCLLDSGAACVYALTIAKALPKHGLDQSERFASRAPRGRRE